MNKPSLLTDREFRLVVESTPLVSIDLLLQNAAGQILLGLRRNRPAQGCWFVPGGRVLKDETLDAAFRRLAHAELGTPLERSQARLLGVYEHFYSDSVFGSGETNPGTHYVVLGYQLKISEPDLQDLPQSQHEKYRWWSSTDMRASAMVHENTRAYLDALH